MNPLQNQPRLPNEVINARNGANLLYVLVAGHATCFTVFLRSGFGSEALGRNGLVAFLMLVLYSGGTRDPWMWTYSWSWLVALVIQRIQTFRLRRAGIISHSQYAGDPVLAMKYLRAPNERSARGLELLVCFGAGLFLLPVSESLGLFVMSGFVSLLVVLGIDIHVTQTRLRAMRDTVLEQKYMLRLFRGED